eukprot:CAMPEP_0206256568 /NCGR_PEP_ID=MMETSP0047_2-20121206/24849_1 /ASSEMBLY_ACC=CAM_ASM_000192 /TAXON_ID=195065 /ORGANISM="Chroomonas mesostigmatica_cf, Strain CCMP1168" /LENGTH=33 /DNA_ID= /DNA_START= /DNA_END= /DNA_ORIENTATION=
MAEDMAAPMAADMAMEAAPEPVMVDDGELEIFS